MGANHCAQKRCPAAAAATYKNLLFNIVFDHLFLPIFSSGLIVGESGKIVEIPQRLFSRLRICQAVASFQL
jgi:hypothetical protein